MARGGKIRVGLIFGGRSGEHEISIRSARSVVDAIDRSRFELTLIGIDVSGSWHLYSDDGFRLLAQGGAAAAVTEVVPISGSDGRNLVNVSRPESPVPPLDVVFPILHGPYGEDGTIQGLLELADLPYVGSGVLGSAIGMDKDVQKRLLRDSGIPIVPFVAATASRWAAEPEEIEQCALALGLPLFVKPANLGSSIGISKVTAAGRLRGAIEGAFAYDTKVIIERGIDAREIECSVLGNDDPRASVPGEIEPGAEFYNYEAKYDADSHARLIIPAPLTPVLVARVRDLAVRTFQTIECAGMARVDFLLDRRTSDLYVNELNTIPGFTSISMYAKLWEASGVPYRELITRLIDLALERHEARARIGSARRRETRARRERLTTDDPDEY